MIHLSNLKLLSAYVNAPRALFWSWRKVKLVFWLWYFGYWVPSARLFVRHRRHAGICTPSIYLSITFIHCLVFVLSFLLEKWWYNEDDGGISTWTDHTYIFYLHPFANMFRSLVRRMFFPSYQTCPSRVTLWTATHTHTFPLCASTILCLNHFRFEFQ